MIFTKIQKKTNPELKKISIILPVHNRKGDTLECLDYFSNQTYKNHEIVVISSVNKDGTDDAIQRLFPKTRLLATTDNIYWTTSVEQGIDFVLENIKDTTHFLTMNDDVSVQKDYLEKLISVAIKNPNSLICSTCFNYYNNSELYYCGINMDWKKYQFIHKASMIPGVVINPDNDVLTGRGTLIPIEVIQAIGNFDGNTFPQYLGDYDFSVRAKKKGFDLSFAYQAKIFAKREKTVEIGRNREFISLDEAWSFLTKQTPLNILYHGRFIQRHCPEEFKKESFEFMIKEMLLKSLYKVKL